MAISTKMETFLKNFFKSQAYANMSTDYKNGYSDLASRGLLNAEQESWRTAATTTLAAAELDEVYMFLLEMFRTLDSQKTTFTNNEGMTKFLNENFGAGKMFGPYRFDKTTYDNGWTGTPLWIQNAVNRGLSNRVATSDEAQLLTEILADSSNLNNVEHRTLMLRLLTEIEIDEGKIANLYADYDKYVGYFGVASTPTEQDTIKAKLREIIDDINTHENRMPPYSGITPESAIPAANAMQVAHKAMSDVARNMKTPIETDLAKNRPTAPAPALNFDQVAAEKFLAKLSSKKEIFDTAIQSMTNYEVKATIYNAVNAVDYKNGKNKIMPKHDDKKRLFERAGDKIKDFGDNYLGKYFDKTKRRMLDPVSRAVIEQIQAAKFDPHKGLADLIAKADEIKGNLPAMAADSFDWMIKKLQPLKKTKQFTEAMFHGNQLNELVKDLNRAVAAEAAGKPQADLEKIFAKAQSMHFLLDALSYGMTSSATRDAFNDKDNQLNIGKGTEFERAWNGIPNMLANKAVNTALSAVFEFLNTGKNVVRGNSIIGRRAINEKAEQRALAAVEAEFRSNPAKTLSDFQRDAATKRGAWEKATRQGDPRASALEQRMRDADLLVKAKEMFDDRNPLMPGGLPPRPGTPLPTPKHNTELDLRLQLDVHWGFIRSGKTTEFEPRPHNQMEKRFFTNPGGVPGTSIYNEKMMDYLRSRHGRMVA